MTCLRSQDKWQSQVWDPGLLAPMRVPFLLQRLPLHPNTGPVWLGSPRRIPSSLTLGRASLLPAPHGPHSLGLSLEPYARVGACLPFLPQLTPISEKATSPSPLLIPISVPNFLFQATHLLPRTFLNILEHSLQSRTFWATQSLPGMFLLLLFGLSEKASLLWVHT